MMSAKHTDKPKNTTLTKLTANQMQVMPFHVTSMHLVCSVLSLKNTHKPEESEEGQDRVLMVIIYILLYHQSEMTQHYYVIIKRRFWSISLKCQGGKHQEPLTDQYTCLQISV